MSKRGFLLFSDYVANKLNQPDLAALRGEDHVRNLIAEADAAGIPVLEITEEVGHIGDALTVMKERNANRA